MDIEIEVRVFTRHDNPNPNDPPVEVELYSKEKSVKVNSKAEVWDAFDDIKITAAQKVKEALVEEERINNLIETADRWLLEGRDN